MAPISGDWLTLSEASQVLGVHSITLRAWVDAGKVQAFRTPGGHRRFRRTELLEFVEQHRAAPESRTLVPAHDHALQRIREEMGSKPMRQAKWYMKLTERQRARQRELGQRLLGLLLQFVSRQENAHQFLDEAQTLARQYGSELARAGLASADVARGFLFFRRTVINATYAPDSTRAQVDADGVRLLQRINEFMDELLIATLGAFDQALPRTVPASPPRHKSRPLKQLPPVMTGRKRRPKHSASR